MIPPIGARIVRRSSARRASRTSSSAVRAASRASRTATSVVAPRACSSSNRSSVASASATSSSVRARAITSASSSRRAMTSPGATTVPDLTSSEVSRPETSGVTDTECIARPSPIAETRPADSDVITAEPMTTTAPPPRSSPDSGPVAAPPAAGNPSRAITGAASGRNAAQASTASAVRQSAARACFPKLKCTPPLRAVEP